MRCLTPLFMTLVAACAAGSQSGPDATIRLTPPGEVDLVEGQSVEVTRPNSPVAQVITFTRVSSDSRCPANAQCVWAGDAVVVLALSGETTGTETLHTPTNTVGPTSTSVGPFLLELLGLAPQPLAGVTRQEPYRVTLRVTVRP